MEVVDFLIAPVNGFGGYPNYSATVIPPGCPPIKDNLFRFIHNLTERRLSEAFLSRIIHVPCRRQIECAGYTTFFPQGLTACIYKHHSLVMKRLRGSQIDLRPTVYLVPRILLTYNKMHRDQVLPCQRGYIRESCA